MLYLIQEFNPLDVLHYAVHGGVVHSLHCEWIESPLEAQEAVLEYEAKHNNGSYYICFTEEAYLADREKMRDQIATMRKQLLSNDCIYNEYCRMKNGLGDLRVVQSIDEMRHSIQEELLSLLKFWDEESPLENLFDSEFTRERYLAHLESFIKLLQSLTGDSPVDVPLQKSGIKIVVETDDGKKVPLRSKREYNLYSVTEEEDRVVPEYVAAATPAEAKQFWENRYDPHGSGPLDVHMVCQVPHATCPFEGICEGSDDEEYYHWRQDGQGKYAKYGPMSLQELLERIWESVFLVE